MEIFKGDNLGIPHTVMGIASEDDSTWDDVNNDVDENDGESNNKTNNEDSYFNYMYSYDFTPEWSVDPKEHQTVN